MTATPAARRSDTARALRVRARADLAANVVAPYYGLDAAIAVNPVLPALGDGFAAAVSSAAPALGGRGVLPEHEFRAHLAAGRIGAAELAASIRRHRAGTPGDDAALVARFLAEAPAGPATARADAADAAADAPLDPIDELVAGWCRAALAPEAAAWPVPVDRLGFYGAWRAIARRDPALPRAARARIAELPEKPDLALARALDLLGIADDEQLPALRAHLAALPGWAAFIRWRSMTSGDVEVLDLLAVRLGLVWALDAAPVPAPRPAGPTGGALERALIWQEAFEAAPHAAVLAQLTPGAAPTHPAAVAHLVFCIDPRSEGLRRHLESQGAYTTAGFAGFFGIAAAVEPLAAAEAAPACPVLLTPRYQVAERPEPGAWRAAARLIDQLATRRALRSAVKAPDAVAGAPLGWAEVTGWMLGPSAIARSVLAGRGLPVARPDEAAAPTLFDLDSALTLDDQVDTAEVILRTMGLVENFAPVVVLVGHGTTTTNNAFRTALDCGACGGHRGAPNARIAAALLSAPAVRAGLAERSIRIPDETVVVAGEHDTATDTLTVFDLENLRVDHRLAVEQLVRDAAAAGRGLAAERAAELPGAPRVRRPEQAAAVVARRAGDWAQVYPEWGLARNAALIIGPRTLSQSADLGRRVFLHSYEAAHDAEGIALETILTAPLVVAHWINAQYYFSAVDPEVLGAGSKTVHNLIGGSGVISGPTGDLRLGLPWQSIGTRDGLHHEPLRLLVVVDAPRERIDRIIDSAEIVADLVHGEWVIMVRPGPAPGAWERRTREGWQPYALTTSITRTDSTRTDSTVTTEEEAA
jgi:uncharacterized protein YbcC (UPF0753/DUF2309 family)